MKHAESRRKEGLCQWHLHLTSVGQSSEQPVGLSLISHRKRWGKAFEARLPFASAVRSQHRSLTNSEAHMQHFVLGAGRAHIGIRVIFEAHQRRHLGAKRFAVKFACLLAAAVEKQVGLYSVIVLS